MTVSDIDNYYQDLVNKNISFFKDIMTNEYDVNGKTYLDKEFLIQDPDGYLLRFNN